MRPNVVWTCRRFHCFLCLRLDICLCFEVPVEVLLLFYYKHCVWLLLHHDRVQHFDIYMRSSHDIDSQVPCTVEILESCTIPVS